MDSVTGALGLTAVTTTFFRRKGDAARNDSANRLPRLWMLCQFLIGNLLENLKLLRESGFRFRDCLIDIGWHVWSPVWISHL